MADTSRPAGMAGQWIGVPAGVINEEQHLGNCDADVETLRAKVQIALKADDAPDTVLHETLHVLVADLAIVGDYAGNMLGAEAKALVRGMTAAAAERLVCRLERTIVALAKRRRS